MEMNNLFLNLIQSTDATETFDDGYIKKGIVYYHELDGTFVVGYVIENGFAIKRLVKKERVNTAGFLSFLFQEGEGCYWDLVNEEVHCPDYLAEVVITVPNTFHEPILFEDYAPTATEEDDPKQKPKGGGGPTGEGDDEQQNCSPGHVKDANGKCVKKPCKGDAVQNPQIAP